MAYPHVAPSPPVLPLSSLLSGWLLHCLPLVWLVVALPLLMRAIASCHAPLHAISSCISSLDGYCVASPHAATSHLPVPLLSIIVLLPLVAPWPPVPLVQLVVALPLLTLPPPICRPLCLSLLLHGLTSRCAVASCSASLRPLSCWLVVVSSLPLPPPLTCWCLCLLLCDCLLCL
jgi:hypothetical protein